MEAFVSYARRSHESAFVQRLVVAFKAKGVDTWVDVSAIEPGAQWSAEIDAAIHRAFALVLVVSNAGANSSYVNYEWAFALGARLPVLPVRLEPDAPLHARLGSLQFIDCSVDEASGLARLVEWVQSKEDPNFRVLKELETGLQSASTQDKQDLLRRLLAIPGKASRRIAVDYVERAITTLRSTTSPKVAERELAALLRLHASGVPGIQERLVTLNYEVSGNHAVGALVSQAVMDLVLRGHARGI